MKPKKVVLIGIAVCAISVLLMSPALANGDDYVLGVYGNANEDDTIDMRDLTYVKLIFFGKKPETELSDAKYDGKINPLDFIQIKLIIVGKEKEITIVDSADRIVTVKKSVERIAFLNTNTAEILRTLEVEDRVVGVPSSIPKKYAGLFPVMADKSIIGGFTNPNYEKILEVNPQILLNYPGRAPGLEEKLKDTGIEVILMGFDHRGISFDNEVKILGFILGKKDRVEEFLDWKNEYLNLIESRTEELKDEEKIRVFIGKDSMKYLFKTATQRTAWHDVVTLAGGKNIAADLGTEVYFVVDQEWVLEQNPAAVILIGFTATGYHRIDDTEAKKVREEALKHPILKETDAGKQRRVYVLNHYLTTVRQGIGICYVAKWLYPELFEDIHPDEINREYFERFLRAEYKGTYAYPLPD